MSELTRTCPAKLNLGLEVIGRRPDGYHELVTIFVPLSLADTLTVAHAGTLTLSCSDPLLATPDNLCLRAARAIQAATGERRGAHLTLTKRIPVAAGLGGGSSDAAAALLLLNTLWETGLTDAELAGLARELGADVPFFLTGGAALARGIGDELTPLPASPACWSVLVTPDVAVLDKTARLYRALTPADWSDGQQTLAQAARLARGLPPDPALIVNAFRRPLWQAFPAVRTAAAALAQAGATGIFPTGSGPTLVALARDETEARAWTAALVPDGMTVQACHAV
jgi:4-diphosphocytidyl-2-C-methyl-D-erythritol kinase